MSLDSESKFISLILRHKPEAIGITLDEHGWADVEELVAGVSRTRPFSMEMLEEIVRTDSKQRYSFSEDKRFIRANQGHSVKIDAEIPEAEPPELLYHGTAERVLPSIMEQGLLPMARLYVHLSKDEQTAVKVGSRHGKPVVLEVNAGQMRRDGHTFWLSVNGVWLAKSVPPEYLRRI